MTSLPDQKRGKRGTKPTAEISFDVFFHVVLSRPAEFYQSEDCSLNYLTFTPPVCQHQFCSIVILPVKIPLLQGALFVCYLQLLYLHAVLSWVAFVLLRVIQLFWSVVLSNPSPLTSGYG